MKIVEILEEKVNYTTQLISIQKKPSMENVQDDHRLCRFYDMLLNSYNVLVDNMVPLSLLIILVDYFL